VGEELLAGRSYARVYQTSGKEDVHRWLLDSVERSGGRVLYASPHTRAPTYLGIEIGEDRLGVLAYVFRATRVVTSGRPADEVRLQVRYGGEGTWHTEEHPLGRDVAGVDVTIVVGVDLEHDILVGLDPLRYQPLPMGISVELKDDHVAAVQRDGWHVWEREKRAGRVRDARAPEGLETMVGLRAERLLDYVRLERQADALGLDSPLRFAAARAAVESKLKHEGARHLLERQFALTSTEILDIIKERGRLEMAVRGGVAEHHLRRALDRESQVTRVLAVDRDGGDFDIELREGSRMSIECKNASPTRYANGDFRVEVQKTRASKGDPASRYYRRDQFDVVAACLFSATGAWEFRYQLTGELRVHEAFPDRLAAMQRVDGGWKNSISAVLAEASSGS
jgi:hypothetical protein